MARKTPQQTNILVHLALWGLGTPALFIAAGSGLFTLIGAPSHETLLVTVLAAFAGILIGFPLGIISFFVTRGARGWGQYFDERNAQKTAESEAALINQVEGDLAEHPATSGTLPASDDPWNGTNPYGCCQDNYDADGNLSHGSPDCLHPLILEQRNAS